MVYTVHTTLYRKANLDLVFNCSHSEHNEGAEWYIGCIETLEKIFNDYRIRCRLIYFSCEIHASIKSPCAYGKSGKIGGTGTKGPVLNFVYLLIIPSSISLFIICTSFSHIKFKIFSLLDRISTLWTFILYCLMPSTTYTELSAASPEVHKNGA